MGKGFWAPELAEEEGRLAWHVHTAKEDQQTLQRILTLQGELARVEAENGSPTPPAFPSFPLEERLRNLRLPSEET